MKEREKERMRNELLKKQRNNVIRKRKSRYRQRPQLSQGGGSEMMTPMITMRLKMVGVLVVVPMENIEVIIKQILAQ